MSAADECATCGDTDESLWTEPDGTIYCEAHIPDDEPTDTDPAIYLCEQCGPRPADRCTVCGARFLDRLAALDVWAAVTADRYAAEVAGMTDDEIADRFREGTGRFEGETVTVEADDDGRRVVTVAVEVWADGQPVAAAEVVARVGGGPVSGYAVVYGSARVDGTAEVAR